MRWLLLVFALTACTAHGPVNMRPWDPNYSPTPSYAETIANWSRLDPPQAYLHAFAGELVEHPLPTLEQVADACADLSARHGWDLRITNPGGCAFPISPTYCQIVYWQADRGLQTRIRNHEIAHCNGWAWDHPA